MNRRKILFTTGITLVSPIAGCIGDQSSREEDSTDSDDYGQREDDHASQEDEDIANDDNSDMNADEEPFTCESGDAGAPIDVEDYPGIDYPPHDIEEQEWEKDQDKEEERRRADEWDRHYLGRCMDREPSIPFEQIKPGGRRDLTDDALLPEEKSFWAQLIQGQEDVDAIWTEPPEALTEVDFAEQVAVVVQTGWGSGSYSHEWIRVEDGEHGGPHLHGYRVRPLDILLDDTVVVRTIVVDWADRDIDRAVVSLTNGSSVRRHFTTDDGPLDDDEFTET